MKRDYLPQWSMAERERRWTALRNAMDKNDLDCLFVWANNRSWGIGLQNFRYITHVGAISGATFKNATMLVEEIRMIKSPEEITFLQKSGDIAQAMVQRMVDCSRPGIPEAEVYAEMHKSLLVNGGEDYVFNIFDSGNLDDPDLHLQHGKENPLTPTMRMLRPNDLIMTEFHSNYGGYLTGCEKTVFLGKAPAELQGLHELCLESFEQGTSAMKPGNLFRDAVEAFRKPVLKAGMDFIELGLHGHGIGSPEYPTRVYKPSNSHTLAGAGVDNIVLQENMVFGTNIDIHNPKWRSDVGLMFGDTVVVTAKGPRSLINTPRDLEKRHY